MFCSSPAPPDCYTDMKPIQFSFICKARFTEHTAPKQLYSEYRSTFAFRDFTGADAFTTEPKMKIGWKCAQP